MNVRVTGFPFMLQGFNNTYKLVNKNDSVIFEGMTKETSDWFFPFEKINEIKDMLFKESPDVFYMEPYYLYGLISIYGVVIFKYKGIWRMMREPDLLNFNLPQEKVFGKFILSKLDRVHGDTQSEVVGVYKNPWSNYTVYVTQEFPL